MSKCTLKLKGIFNAFIWEEENLSYDLDTNFTKLPETGWVISERDPAKCQENTQSHCPN